jgi:hypothetical protein
MVPTERQKTPTVAVMVGAASLEYASVAAGLEIEREQTNQYALAIVSSSV